MSPAIFHGAPSKPGCGTLKSGYNRPTISQFLPVSDWTAIACTIQEADSPMKQPAGTHLAQLNVATALDDLDSERLADFVGALDKINATAERSPGFVWRLKDEGGSSIDIKTSENSRFIVNLSVWETPSHLEHFVWNTAHKHVYRKKANWFERPKNAYFVMWWVPEGHMPSAEEALDRLADLNADGPGERAFGWESLPNIKLRKREQCA
jgi:hypothetical protein